MSEIRITDAWEVRYGTDGIGLTHGYVHADSMEKARTLAAEKLAADGYTLQADKGLFTVHGCRFDDVSEPGVSLLTAAVVASLNAPECDTAWQNEETCSPESPCTACWHAR